MWPAILLALVSAEPHHLVGGAPVELRVADEVLAGRRVSLDRCVEPPALAVLAFRPALAAPPRPAPLAFVSTLLAQGVGMADRTILRYLPGWSAPSVTTLGDAASRYLTRQLVKLARSAFASGVLATPSAAAVARSVSATTPRRRTWEWAAAGGSMALIAGTTWLLLGDRLGASSAMPTQPALTAVSLGFGGGAGTIAVGLEW